jgi:hypothetical protein
MAFRALLSSVCVVLAVTGDQLASTVGSPAAQAQDDTNIVAAAFEHSVRPEVIARRGDGERNGPFFVFENNIPICSGVRAKPCVNGPSVGVEVFEPVTGPPIGDWGPAQPSVGTEVRKELITSFRARNAESRPLPRFLPEGLEFVPQSALAGLDEASNDRQGRISGYAAFSLPGYSRDGHALLYGMFMCGGRCGFTWLFVVERQTVGWRVVARRLVGIR